MAGIDFIHQNGVDYEIVPEIAELFSTTKTYHTGDHVIYEAGWYTFKTDKYAGAWDATKVNGPFKVSEQLTDLKEDLVYDRNDFDDYKLEGLAYYGLISTFVNGSLTNGGVVYPNYQYRVATEAVQHSTNPIDIVDIDSAFFIRIIYFTDSTATEVSSSSNVLRKDCPYRIPSGSYFRFFIRRVTENTSEIADIATFRKAVRIANYLDEYLDDESPKLSSYFYDSMENAYIDSNGTVQANASSALSDWIKVRAGDKIKYKLMGGKAGYLFVLCNSKFVNANSIVYGILGEGIGPYESLYVTGEYIVPSDGYMRYSYNIEYCNDGYFYVENALQTESAVRLNMLEDTVNAPIPSYWEIPIETAEDAYSTHIKSSSPNLVSFPFITDIHWGRNAKHSPRLINRLCRDLGMSFVVVGGDIETASEETADECTAITNDFLRRFNRTLFATIGNHDNNSDKTVDENIIVTSGTLYDSFYRPHEQYVNTDGERNGYYDIPSHKTRIIAIDTGTPIWYKGQNIGTDYNYQRLEDSIDWAYSKISELDSAWHVILVTHIIWGGAPTGETPTMQSWVTNRLKTGILDKAYSAEIIALFCGHLHRDIDGTLASTNGTKTLLIIGTTTDNYNLSSNWGGPTMTIGTATEQAFDLVQVDLDNKNIYMTRVGAGNSRSFSYE